MIMSTILSLLGLGVICWVLFNLAVYALPFFVAVTVGHTLYTLEVGLVVAIATAFFAGAATLILGQIAFATIRSTPIRLALGMLYALPAGIAGFHAIKGLSRMGGAGETWTLAVATIGAIIIGVTAWARVAVLAGPEEDASKSLGRFSGGGEHMKPTKSQTATSASRYFNTRLFLVVSLKRNGEAVHLILDRLFICLPRTI